MRLVVARRQARGAQHRGDAGERHRLVLGGERVDRRRDDAHPCMVEALPHERLAREHVRVRHTEIGHEEAPGLARDVIGEIEPDIARQITGTSVAARRAGSIPAVCGSWRITTSPGRSISSSAAALAAHRARGARSRLAEGPAVAQHPCSRLCMRLVRRKNSVSPSMTTQRPSIPLRGRSRSASAASPRRRRRTPSS